MDRSSMAGSRIRERRVSSGLKQTELAKAAGISASYLNLIEHNRRRIGGKTLNKLADVLDVSPALLSDGAEAALITGLLEAAGDDAAIETSRVEEFAGRFPGWAKLVTDLCQQREDLVSSVKALTDRIAHDPELSQSLHEVISTVTSIRSAASILADGQSLEPQWQNRFHRNINEDSERLASGAEALVRYLEGAPGGDVAVRTPLEQVHAFLSASDHHFSELEGAGGSARIESIVARSELLASDPARTLAQFILDQYVRDARSLPLSEIAAYINEVGVDPVGIAEKTGQSLATVIRRLANLPEGIVGQLGFFMCDATGRMIVQKPSLGIDVFRAETKCTSWPLFQVLSSPGQVIQTRIRQGDVRVLALAVNFEVRPASVNRQAICHAQMLILPDNQNGPVRPVGASCSLCVEGICGAM